VEAWHHNEFLFVLSAILAASILLLNLYWVFDLKWAKVVLKKIYNIPVLIISVLVMLLFLFVRNIPAFINVGKLILMLIEKASA
jgi:hypothetical protein